MSKCEKITALLCDKGNEPIHYIENNLTCNAIMLKMTNVYTPDF